MTSDACDVAEKMYVMVAADSAKPAVAEFSHCCV